MATQTQNSATKKPLTKTQLLQELADQTGLTKAQCGEVLTALEDTIRTQLGRKGAGKINIPGLLKIEKIKKPARKAKKGVPNPFKPGELMDVAAKPATNVVKVRPLKTLKDMA